MSALLGTWNRRYILPLVLFLGTVALGALAPRAQAALFNFNWESGGTPDTAVVLHGGYHVSVPSNAVLLAKSPAPKAAPRTVKQAANADRELPPRGFLTIRPKPLRLPTQSAR